MSDDTATGILADLDALLRHAQAKRGLQEYFAVGDTVWFPGGMPGTETVPFVIHKIYNNGFIVHSPEGYEQQILDEAVLRLGMTHTPPEVNP